MFHWLVIAYPTTLKEKQICLKTLDAMCLQSECIVFVYMFGPNVNSPIQMFQIDTYGIHDLGNISHPNKNEKKYKKYDLIFSDIITKFYINKIPIHGVVYYGHSSGIILGLWKGQKILTTVARFVKKILIPLQPTILIFDSCYMGTISALYELSSVTSLRFVLASPHFHPAFSVLETKGFGKITNTKDIPHLQEITCEFQALKRPKYRCLLLCDIKKIPPLVEKLQLAIKSKQLIFDNNSVVNKKEDLYDLYSSAQTTVFKNQIRQVTGYSCNITNCHKIRGVTIDIVLPALHLQVYKKMMWFQKMKDYYDNNKIH